MSSDSDFEDESARKAKRLSSVRQQTRRLAKSDSEVVRVTQSSDAESARNSSFPRSGSPVETRVCLNGINVSARVNLPQMEDDFRNRLRRNPDNITDRHIKRNRKRLFCEVSVKPDETESPRLLRSNSAGHDDQWATNVVLEKRVCRPNGVVNPESDEKNTTSRLNLSNLDENRPKKEDKVDIRLTRSRSRTSGSDSPKSSAALSTLDNEQSEDNEIRAGTRRTRSCGSRTRSLSDEPISIPAVNGRVVQRETRGKCEQFTRHP